jgi:glyoxylase-like metal-dependent hydrolase (beta-lactamase superfamily II)
MKTITRSAFLVLSVALAAVSTPCASPAQTPASAATILDPTSALANLDPTLVAAGKARVARMDAERAVTQKVGDSEFPSFRLVGNTYSVGTNSETSYLIKTSDGLILIDMTYEQTAPWIAKAIESRGFKLADIRILLGSHSHPDHVGGMAWFKERAPLARTMIMDADAAILEKGVIGRDGSVSIRPVKADRILKDGDKITLGDTTLTAWKTAGHTPGATSFEWMQTDNGKAYNVVLVGSQFTAIEGYPGVKDDQIRTWNRYLSLHPDVWVGGHTWQHGQTEKYEAMKAHPGTNPFIDPQGYRELIAARSDEFVQRLKDPSAPDSRGTRPGATTTVPLGGTLAATAPSLAVAQSFGAPATTATGSRATAICSPGDQPETGMQGETPLKDIASGRNKSPYFCGLRIISRTAPWGPASNGFLKRSRTCAYVSGSGPQGRGIAVIDVANPKAPKVVGFLTDPGAAGASESMDVMDAGDRHILVAADYSGGLDPPGPSPMAIYDLTDCTRPKLVSTFNWPANIHVPLITSDAKRVFAGRQFGTAGMLVADISDLKAPKYMGDFHLILPGGRQQRCHDMWTNAAQTRLYCPGSVPMIEGRKLDSAPSIWDISRIGTTDLGPQGAWPPVKFVGTSSMRGQGDHHIPLAVIKGVPYLVGANELRCSAFPRLFDISDETNLRAVGEFRLESNDRCLADPDWAKANAAGNYGLHYNDVVDNAWGNVALGMFNFMGSGLRVVDLRDPTRPREVAYYHPGAPSAPPAPASEEASRRPAPVVDSCMSHNYFVHETNQIWFSCTSGFYIAELSPAVKAYLGVKTDP